MKATDSPTVSEGNQHKRLSNHPKPSTTQRVGDSVRRLVCAQHGHVVKLLGIWFLRGGPEGALEGIGEGRKGVGQPFGAVRAVFELITPVNIAGVSLNGVIRVINFTGAEGVSDWRVMGSEDLVTFPFDRTADSIIIETSPGNYRADVDLSAGSPAAYFVRIER